MNNNFAATTIIFPHLVLASLDAKMCPLLNKYLLMTTTKNDDEQGDSLIKIRCAQSTA